MKYYLLQEPSDFTAHIEFLDLHQFVDYRYFAEDQMYRLPSRLMLRIRHKEYREYPDILVEPFPLFSESAWKTIGFFAEKLLYTHFILMDERTRDCRSYYTPSPCRIKGRVETSGKGEDTESVRILSEDAMPEDMPLIFIDDRGKIKVLMGLDLLESLMRKGLCDIRLLPVKEIRTDTEAGKGRG